MGQVKRYQKQLKNFAEFVAVWVTHKIFGLLSLSYASKSGGWLVRTLAPFYKRGSRIAQRNLERAFPEKSPQQIQQILTGMWDNLGRIVGEYAHLGDFYRSHHIHVEGLEHLIAARDDGKPGLFFAGHIANWEAAAVTILKHKVPLAQVYRAANNPLVNRMVRQAQVASTQHLIAKGPQAGREILKAMQEGSHIMMMVDQKMDNGIPVPFFGPPAMTAPALAKLALKFQCPLIPVRVERLEGVRFKVTFFPPLDLQAITHQSTDPVLAVMTRVNEILESWIRDRPDLWLWVHQRWPLAESSK